MNINELLSAARAANASDVHITDGVDPVFRIDGALMPSGFQMSFDEKQALILSMLNDDLKQQLDSLDDADFCFVSGGERHRVNVYRRRGTLAAAIRVIRSRVPTVAELNLPPVISELSLAPRGLVLVTGPTGSGKSTTLAAMIDLINTSCSKHIITIEDPIEYLHEHKSSLIEQRELGSDTKSFSAALRSSLREDPDVILVGEMRDYETISAAITAAETGHLVFSTLHTIGAANAVDRIIDVFPPHSQQQIRTQLAGVLRGIITQQLLPRNASSGRVAAFEILTGTDAALNMIRDNKCFQFESVMQTGERYGMITMDMYLKNLLARGEISPSEAREKALRKSEF